MKIAALLRSAALVTAVALIPATTATMAQVDGRAGPEFAKLFAVFQRVKASYVEPVEDEVLIRGAIDGMLAALDPHSAYLDGSDLQRLETMIDGQYSGLGLSVVMEDGAVKVISPFRGSPADSAGVKAGDFITHLDGRLIYGGNLDDAVAQMRGPAGSAIRLTIFRPGRDEPLEVDVTRGVIALEPVTHEVAAGNIGVISVNEFSANVGADVFAAWQEILKKAPGGRVNGLVLDLRNNPGGSLDESVALSDLFLTSGRIVSQRGRARGETMLYDAETVYPGDMAEGVPMIVLINAGSASASEIVAGA
ncbi:MAG: S41 family peptidase, partial [Erythrobacter sp.]|nr:S41 family peptidase [Erythrobacter sp.]